MRDRKDDRVQVNMKMPAPLVESLDTLAKRQFRSRSDIVRQALMRELEANGLVPVAAA